VSQDIEFTTFNINQPERIFLKTDLIFQQGFVSPRKLAEAFAGERHHPIKIDDRV